MSDVSFEREARDALPSALVPTDTGEHLQRFLRQRGIHYRVDCGVARANDVAIDEVVITTDMTDEQLQGLAAAFNEAQKPRHPLERGTRTFHVKADDGRTFEIVETIQRQKTNEGTWVKVDAEYQTTCGKGTRKNYFPT